MTSERYPKGHPLAGQFKPTGRVNVKRLRAMLRSAVLSTDPEVQEVLDTFRAINPDATKRRRREGDPIPASSLVMLDGTIHDEIASMGRTFRRRREGVYPTGGFTMVRFHSNQSISDDEIDHALQIIGYAWKQTMSTGERLTRAERDGVNSFVVWADARESRRTNVRRAVEEFETDVVRYFVEGTPMRTSNRIDRTTGKPMSGTRLVDALGGDHRFELYYDAVTDEPFPAPED